MEIINVLSKLSQLHLSIKSEIILTVIITLLLSSKFIYMLYVIFIKKEKEPITFTFVDVILVITIIYIWVNLFKYILLC